MVNCGEMDCYLELFDKDVVDTELDKDGNKVKIYRCPKCFKLAKG